MLITLTFGGNKRSNYFTLERKLNDVLMKLTYFLVYGLKCYECVSTKGWDDCADIKTEKECPSFTDRCANTKLKEQAGKCLPRCSPRDVQLKSSATKMTNQSFASFLGQKVMSTAKSTAARETCVTEPKY